MDLSGQDMHSNYRHTEIHQWITTGPSVMNPMGAGSLIPMNWTITGNGYLEELPAVAGGTTNLRIWTISGGRGVHINLVVIGGNLLFHPSEPAASVVGHFMSINNNGLAVWLKPPEIPQAVGARLTTV
jgi:hypothetical protein